jgi:AraC-like DNA-binding protein
MARVDTHNRSHYWQDPHTSGLSLMCADFSTHAYAPHRHEEVVLAVTELGGSVIKSRGVVGEAHERAFLIFNPLEPHAGDMGSSSQWRFRSFYLQQSALQEIADAVGVDQIPYFTQNFFGDTDLIAGFLTLHRALQSGQRHGHDPFRQRELLVTTFGAFFARHGPGSSRPEPGPRDRGRLRRAVDLMHAHLDNELLLGDLSGALGLTEYQLASLFKRATGMTPHAYLTQLRLDRARSHLAAGMPVAEVAVASGFYDQSALTKHFKRSYGVTPLQYARATRR